MFSQFSLQHLSMACKYGGISFIAGAVSHGVFSESRALATAGVGLGAFVIGTLIEQSQKQPADRQSAFTTVALGALLGIGIGFFTGSLQHFPDSPARSVWVVPLGFALSLLGLALLNRESFFAQWRYIVLSLVLVAAGSVGAYQFFVHFPHDHGSHDHGSHGHGTSAHDHGTPPPAPPAHDHSTHTH